MSSYKLAYTDDDNVEVGLDEAGRGCLFGRLYVGAVIFPKEYDVFFDNGVGLNAIKDSKKLTERKRNILFDYIKECAIETSVAYSEVEEIDKINILQADIAAMHRALDNFETPFQRILVDGDYFKSYSKDRKIITHHTIVDGDASYLSIAAASVLAKVSRDNWIEEICETYPEYDTYYSLLSNKGYGTPSHMKGIKEHGVVVEHRTSFAPVRISLGLPVEKEKKKGLTKAAGGAGTGPFLDE
jgi:ribonuclease HII